MNGRTLWRHLAAAAVLATTLGVTACADEPDEARTETGKDMPTVVATPNATTEAPAVPASDPSVPETERAVDPAAVAASHNDGSVNPKPGQNNDHSAPVDDAKR